MALLHRATLSPTKAEIISGWLPAQPWAPDGDASLELASLELVGAYRFDDPEGRVGLEVHLVRSNDVLLQVPLVYRDAPVDGLDARPRGHDAALGVGRALGLRRVGRPGVHRHARRGDADGHGTGDRHGRQRRAVDARAHARPPRRRRMVPRPGPGGRFLDGVRRRHVGRPAQRPARTAGGSPSGRRGAAAHRPHARWPGQLEPVILAEIQDRAET